MVCDVVRGSLYVVRCRLWLVGEVCCLVLSYDICRSWCLLFKLLLDVVVCRCYCRYVYLLLFMLCVVGVDISSCRC